MHPPLRIAILECDTPVPPILKSRGTYGDIFTALLKAGAKRLADKGDPGVEGEDRIDPQRDIETVYFDVVNDVERYPDLGERWDGVLITGSSEFESFFCFRFRVDLHSVEGRCCDLAFVDD